MRCELMQMERMGIDERFGSDMGDMMRRSDEIRRRMRLERKRAEEDAINEYLGDRQAHE